MDTSSWIHSVSKSDYIKLEMEMRIDHHLLEMDRFTGSVIAKHPISSEKASIPIQASEFIEFYTYDEISDFIAAHEVPILSKENQFEIRKSGSPSGLSYEIHTGRELLMMIQGVKPLSVFSKYKGSQCS